MIDARMPGRCARILASLFLTAFIAAHDSSTSAQESGATIAVGGTIKDTSGGVVPGAVAQAIVAGRSLATATAGSDGRYRVQVPSGGPFDLEVRREGFADQVVHLPGSTTDVVRDVILQVGAVSDTLVVTASRATESRVSTTQSLSVLTSNEIQAVGAAQLTDVLRFVPGLAIEGNGREGAVTSVFSRGGESDYNLVLIDGVRVNVSGGQFDFSRIAAGEIERVEVVRGAQSALWGSDAMGSVIQVFTKRAAPGDPPQVSGSMEGGSFNTWRGDAWLTGSAEGLVDYHAGTAYRRTDGAFGDILPEDDRFEQATFDGGVGARLGRRASVRTTLRYSDAEGRGVGNIAYGTRDRGTTADTTDLSWHLDVPHTFGNRFTGTGTVNYFEFKSLTADTIGDPTFNVYALLEGTHGAIFPNGPRLVRLLTQPEFQSLSLNPSGLGPNQFVASTQFGVSDFPFTSETEFRRPAFRYQGDLAWAGAQRLSAGYEWERERNPLVNAFSLDNNAFFVQQQLNAGDRWFVTVGGRVDSKDNYDTFFSPKLSAGGFLVPFRSGGLSSVKVFGNAGKGIKSPTFTERFGGSFADPSPDLKVERARTTDIGLEATFADQRFRGMAVYFNNSYRDQIAFRSGTVGDGIPEFINIDGSKATGWELEGGLQRPVAGFLMTAGYAYVDNEVVTNLATSQQFQPGQPLLRRPRNSGSLRIAYTLGRATANFDARVVGQRHDNSFLSLRTVPNPSRPTAVTTDITVNPGYTVVGLGLDVRVHRSLDVFLRGDNIGDTVWESALGYPGMPRAVYAGARFRIGR